MANIFTNYIIDTATPGGTMSRQGDKAISRLHPEFQRRLDATIREARAEGINASVFSAYRPPGYGVGGYANKFHSLHAYGLAVDFSGVGRPGSKTSKRFYEIATKHGLHNPYGPNNKKEWNHFQLVPEKGRQFVQAHPELAKSITASGPIDSKKMWLASGIPLEGGDNPTRMGLGVGPPEDVGPLGSRRLSEGRSGPDVRKVQIALKRDGYYDGPIDGEYGSKTKAGVLALQKHINEQRRAAKMPVIDEDGIVGPQTRPSLNVRYDLATAPSPIPTQRQPFSSAVDIGRVLKVEATTRSAPEYGAFDYGTDTYNPTEERKARERRPRAVREVTDTRPTYDVLDEGTATSYDYPAPQPNPTEDAPAAVQRDMETPEVELPLIKRGNKERSVVAPIQTFLNRMGIADLNVDGDFGPLTESAVRNYQAERGLQVDGIIGSQTRAAMLKDTFRMSREDERNHQVEQALIEWDMIPIPRFYQPPIPRPRPDAAAAILAGRRR